MFLEVCIFSVGLQVSSDLYKKIKNKVYQIKNKDDLSVFEGKLNNSLYADGQNSESEYLLATRVNDLNNDQINSHLAVTSVCTVLTGTGILFYSPLILIGVLGLAYPLAGMLKGACRGLLKERKANMEIMNFVLLGGMLLSGYYFTGCFVFWSYYLSLKLLNKIEDNTRQDLSNIFENQPHSAWILRNDIEIEVPFDLLQAGDIATVKSGEIVPGDGIVTKGSASIDQHILTGESLPLEKGPGEPVFASTVVLAGNIHIRIEKSGADTVAAGIADILNHTIDFKSTVQSKGERIADQSVPPTLTASAVALLLRGPVGALAVLNSYIGSDISILVPLSTLNFLKVASQKGILIKDGRALELLVKTDTVVFDKTGTLTLEQPCVKKIYACDGYEEREVLRYAAIAEDRQTHPIARAILEKADEYNMLFDKIDDAKYEIGCGVSVKFSGTGIRVGSVHFMEREQVKFTEQAKKNIKTCYKEGNSLVMVSVDSHLAGMIELQVAVRPEVKDIISRLKNRGKSLCIITGDHETPSRHLANKLGIEHCFAESFPEQKSNIIEELQRKGRSVCFVGDGINDSIAMKKAHVSVSMRGASAAATDTANIILLDGTLKQLDELFELSEEFDKNINRSLVMTVAPGLVNIASVFFLHTGIYFSFVLLYLLALPTSVANSFLPLIKYKKRRISSNNADENE